MKKAPMRIFEGNAGPNEPFWQIRDAKMSESGEPEIEFYGYISEYAWDEEDIVPSMFKADLYKVGAGGPVTVRINSPGGSVVAASLLRAILMDYPGKVTCRIDGMCASAATMVAIAGDRVLMQDTAFFMIHDPWTIAFGNEEELKGVIDVLKTTKAAIVAAYESRSNLTVEQIGRMMAAETWMSAKDAQEYGFVDEVVTANPNKVALRSLKNAAILNALPKFQNLPEALAALMDGQTTVPVDVDPLAKRLRAEAKLYA